MNFMIFGAYLREFQNLNIRKKAIQISLKQASVAPGNESFNKKIFNMYCVSPPLRRLLFPVSANF